MNDIDRRRIEKILREEERKGGLLRCSLGAIMEKWVKRESEGWLVFALPLFSKRMRAVVEIEYTFYPPGSEKNEGFEMANLISTVSPKCSYAVVFCKPFEGFREKIMAILEAPK